MQEIQISKVSPVAVSLWLYLCIWIISLEQEHIAHDEKRANVSDNMHLFSEVGTVSGLYIHYKLQELIAVFNCSPAMLEAGNLKQNIKPSLSLHETNTVTVQLGRKQ